MSGPMQVEHTPIPGLLVFRVPVHGDSRGWFKENWQREKMLALGLPDFGPVQNNISFNSTRGATRGIHAEPWDKLVGVASGRVFAAWVDLRAGDSFGQTHHVEINESVVVFVPRGVGNSYQALADDTAYSYLVNAHWRPELTYPALNLADESAAIPWPIPLAEAEISEKDQHNPRLGEVTPFQPPKTLIVGANGQLGRALQQLYPDAETVGRDELDVTSPAAVAAWPWHEYAVVLNAAAYTAVDAAETPAGRVDAWAANATAPALLARAAREHGLTLVHYSSDYVFDGTRELHTEDEPFSPLGVYGQTKAAGDLAVAGVPRHYLLRTSWVVGDGGNFVRTMARLARDEVSPSVVNDQFGRLTFTTDLAGATKHLLDAGAAYGTYNVSSSGPVLSWAQLAREVFIRCGRSGDDVTETTTMAWAAGKVVSPRPRHSALDLGKIEATGFEPAEQLAALAAYLNRELP